MQLDAFAEQEPTARATSEHQHKLSEPSTSESVFALTAAAGHDPRLLLDEVSLMGSSSMAQHSFPMPLAERQARAERAAGMAAAEQVESQAKTEAARRAARDRVRLHRSPSKEISNAQPPRHRSPEPARPQRREGRVEVGMPREMTAQGNVDPVAALNAEVQRLRGIGGDSREQRAGARALERQERAERAAGMAAAAAAQQLESKARADAARKSALDRIRETHRKRSKELAPPPSPTKRGPQLPPLAPQRVRSPPPPAARLRANRANAERIKLNARARATPKAVEAVPRTRSTSNMLRAESTRRATDNAHAARGGSRVQLVSPAKEALSAPERDRAAAYAEYTKLCQKRISKHRAALAMLSPSLAGPRPSPQTRMKPSPSAPSLPRNKPSPSMRPSPSAPSLPRIEPWISPPVIAPPRGVRPSPSAPSLPRIRHSPDPPRKKPSAAEDESADAPSVPVNRLVPSRMLRIKPSPAAPSLPRIKPSPSAPSLSPHRAATRVPAKAPRAHRGLAPKAMAMLSDESPSAWGDDGDAQRQWAQLDSFAAHAAAHKAQKGTRRTAHAQLVSDIVTEHEWHPASSSRATGHGPQHWTTMVPADVPQPAFDLKDLALS